VKASIHSLMKRGLTQFLSSFALPPAKQETI